jgi:predicted acetyltransferase
MAWNVHPVGESDVPAFARLVHGAFGEVMDDVALANATEAYQPDFAIAISDEGAIVATASAYPLELTLPAGAGEAFPIVPAPGVTAVGVAPTHRRRGLLTTLMGHQIADFRERGFPFSLLLASESIIYGRFGYGWAQSYQSLAIETDRSTFRPDAPAPSGRMRLIDAEEASAVLPDVHDRTRVLRPGELNRSSRSWRRHLADPEKDREGAGGRMYALHQSAEGHADGWVSYRTRAAWPAGLPRYDALVDDLVGLDHAIEAALWRFVLDLDLVQEVSAALRPLDDPLRWLLADPRRARTTELADHLWLRVIDVAAALQLRGYQGCERLVLEITSPDPAVGGRFVLETGPTAGSCRRAKSGEKSQLVLPLADLGAIYLGGVGPVALAAAGRVTELHPGALAVAERVFASPVAPFCTLHF